MDHLGPEIAKGSELIGQAIEGEFEGLTLPDVVGAMAVRTIHDAFDTSGFGQWQSNAPKTEEWKGSSMPLIDSNQLRDSIEYETVPV